MSRRVVVAVAVLLLLVVGAGLIIPLVLRARLQANLAASQNNLRELALFAAHHAAPDPTRDSAKLPREIPAATIPLPGVVPDERLSWVVGVLPGLDQKKQNTEQLLATIDKAQPWTAGPNQRAARTRLVVLLCPENPPAVPADAPGVTCYVGIAGVGADAATLPPDAPRAGAFRYDAPTPFDRVTDGLSQTLLFAETRSDVGPWLRGGPSTTRGMDGSPAAPPLVGGQFGGYFPSGANFALCDGSVRIFSPRTSPQVLLGLATIAGKETDVIPGE